MYNSTLDKCGMMNNLVNKIIIIINYGLSQVSPVMDVCKENSPLILKNLKKSALLKKTDKLQETRNFQSQYWNSRPRHRMQLCKCFLGEKTETTQAGRQRLRMKWTEFIMRAYYCINKLETDIMCYSLTNRNIREKQRKNNREVFCNLYVFDKTFF